MSEEELVSDSTVVALSEAARQLGTLVREGLDLLPHGEDEITWSSSNLSPLTIMRFAGERASDWLSSLSKLTGDTDLQAAAAGARALFEVTVDMALLHQAESFTILCWGVHGSAAPFSVTPRDSRLLMLQTFLRYSLRDAFRVLQIIGHEAENAGRSFDVALVNKIQAFNSFSKEHRLPDAGLLGSAD